MSDLNNKCLPHYRQPPQGRAGDRFATIQRIEFHLDHGTSLSLACHREKVTRQWYLRWRNRMKNAIELSLSDHNRTGRPNKENASERIRQTVDIQRRKIKTIQGQLNALSTELDNLEKTISELAPTKDPFAPKGLFFLSEDPDLAYTNR